MVDHSSGNLKLPSVPQDATQEGLEDSAEVFQALAEGLQVALAQFCASQSKRSPFELDSGIRENGAQGNGGTRHGTTHVDR